MKIFQFLAIAMLSCALFADIAPIQIIKPVAIPALNIESIVEAAETSGPSLNENFIVAGGFSPDISSAYAIDPEFFKPEIYTLSQVALSPLSPTMPPSRIETVRYLTSSKDKLALIYNFDSSNNTRIDIHELTGGAMPIKLTKSFAWSNYDTAMFTAASPQMGEILIGGRYRTASSSSRSLLVKMSYAGGANTLTQINIGLSSNSAIADIDSTFTTSPGARDYAMLVDEVSTTHHTGLLFRNYTGGVKYFTFTKDYIYDKHYHVRGGRFMSTTKYGFAFVGSSARATDIYLYDLTGGIFTPKAMKAIKTTTGKNIMASGVVASDLDGDGQEELIIAGGYDTYGNYLKYSDVVQVYRYSGGSLALLGESLNSTGGASWALAVDAYDIDGDGKKEIVTFDWAASTLGGSISKGVANVYEFTSSGLSHASSSDFSPSPASSYNYYNPTRVRFGDFDGDSKKEIAVEYEHKAGYTTMLKLGILELAKDSAGPSITISKPANSTVWKTGNMSIEFTATDSSGVDAPSMKYRIKCTGYDSGSKVGTLSNSSGGKTMMLQASFAANALPLGNCTLTAYASDKGWNSNTKEMQLNVKSMFGLGGVGLDLGFIPLYNFTNASNATNATNVTTPEPEAEATPSPEPEASPEPEVAPAPEATPAPEPEVSSGTGSEGVLPEPETPAETPSGTGSGTGEVETGTATPSGGSSGTAGAAEAPAKAASLITELEVKISVAKQQGEDTAAAEKSLAAAKQAQMEGKPLDAALEAQKGVAAIDQALTGKPAAPATDYTPYLIAAGAIVALGGAYLLFARKPAK